MQLPASWDTTPWEKACSQQPVPRPESFQPLLRKEEDDVCFQVEGSEHLIFCNKQLLCEECEYFRAMFGSSMREAQSSFIPSSACDDEGSGLVQNKFQGSAVFVKDITEGSFLGVLEWLYTKSLSTTDFELLLQIWQDSEMYYLEELKQYCQRRLLQYFRESKDMQQHHDKDPSHLFQYLLAVFEAMDPETTKEDATEEDDDGDSIIFDNCATAHERWDELNSVMRAIIASCILQRLDKVLLYYDGDLIDLVGRLFSVLAMQPYDPHVYPPADEHWLKDIEVWRQRQPTEQDINGSLHKPSLTDEQHSTNAKQRQDEDEGMKMLCFDGGGMRALRQIAIMRELERKTREEGQEGASGICSNFDVICGTGFGGLIALSIGIGKTWDEMTALIWAIFHRVFAKPLGYLRWTLTGTHYDAAALEHIFEEYFGAATMHDLLQPERNCNIMAIAQRMDVHRPILLWPGATPSLQQQQEVALGGTKGEEEEEEDMVLPCTLLRDVAMALVASPGHFPSKPLEMKNGSRILVGDASSLHHNPSYVALTAARRLRPHRRVSLLLSVGCGRMDPSFSPGQSFLSSLLVPPTFLWNRKTKVTPATFDEQSRGATLLASLLLMEGRQQRWERLRRGSSPPHCFRFFTHLSAHNFSQEHSEDEEWHLLPRGLNGNRNKKQLSAYFEDVSLKEKCERGIQEDDQEDELLEGFVVLNATATSIENGKEECSESCFKEGIEEEALYERMLDRIDVLVAKDAKEDGRGYQACAKYFRLNPRDDRIRWNESNAELLRDSVASCSRWIKRINPSLVFHP
ncbi:Ankyrin repeat domain-containing protein (Fragment), variant 3 [Balamuthia mandrillaris]